jgi:hypothetical protein
LTSNGVRKIAKKAGNTLKKMGKICKLVLFLAMIVGQTQSIAQSEPEIADVESTFKFVANVLGTFQRTGRLLDAIGIDGAEYQHFIQLLERSYGEFTRDFSTESRFCQFYLDPENGIMEIEERAVLGYQYLPDLSVRLEYFQQLHSRFEQDVQESYGGQVLDRIRVIKSDITSFEYLPTQELEGAQAINFADTACR